MNFPQVLPAPQQALQIGSVPQLVVNAFEVNTRQRRRYDHTEQRFSVRWLFTQLEFDIFKAFITRKLNDGELPFDMTLVGLDGPVLRTCLIEQGKFQAQYVSHYHWAVNATLATTVAETLLSEDLLDILELPELADPEFFLLIENVLYIYVNEHYGSLSDNTDLVDFVNAYL